MSEVTVAVGRAHFGADHPVRRVAQLADIGGLDGFGEAWPTATGFEFVGRGKQRLTRDDIDIDARLLVVQVFAGAGRLSGALLCDAELLGRQSGNRFGGFDVVRHDLPPGAFSIAAASGMGLPIIGKLLGHSQPATTARYAHLADDPLTAAAAAIVNDAAMQMGANAPYIVVALR